MCADSTSRILGPYHEGSRWRVVQLVDGQRTARTASTRDKALQIIDELRRPPRVPRQARTLGVALREYDAHLRLDRRLSPASCTQARRTLTAFFAQEDLIASVTAAKALALARFEHPQARRIPRRYALSTRYAILGHAFRFFEWAKGRYVESNPFDGLRPMGLCPPGPSPLSLDQARILSAVTLHQATHDPGALGALLVLVMGLRSGQVLPLQVQHIDLNAKRLTLPGPNGPASWRPIPDLLLPCLRAAVHGKDPAALLLGAGRTGLVRPRNFLWRAVKRLSQQACVSSTSPRQLRALHTKLQQTARRTSARLTHAAAQTGVTRAQEAAPSKDSPADWVGVVDLLGLSLSVIRPRPDGAWSVPSP